MDFESVLVGLWTSVNTGDDLSGSTVLGSGHGVLVRVYDYAPGFEDPNPIVEFSPDKVVIQEVSGTLTPLTRVG